MGFATGCRRGRAGPFSRPAGSRAGIGCLPEPALTQTSLAVSAPPPSVGRPVWRIRDRATFARLRAEGRRIKRGPVTVWFVEGDPYLPPRMAYAIGRTVGTAVERNRLRRRLRAIVSD